MNNNTNEFCVKKSLLVWPMPITNRVKALLTMIFINTLEMVKYTCRVLTKTDTFHLLIHLDCFEDLRNDPVYQFPQVARIHVICDNINDMKWAERRFSCEYGKVKFCTIYDLLGILVEIGLDNTCTLSGSTRESAIPDVLSLIEARIAAKQLVMSLRRSQVRKQFASTLIYGYPMRNIFNIDLHFICQSCKLVYQKVYQLECGHHQCEICVNIQKCCRICDKVVLKDKISLHQNSQTAMQNLPTDCSGCEQTQPLKDYEIHLKQNHYEILTCFIQNQQVDESIFNQPYLNGTNQESFAGNISCLNSSVTPTSLNGTCIWEISDYENMKSAATAGGPKSIFSAPFYIFPNGYKMRLRLFLNGDNNAFGTHLSLFLIIMRGDSDQTLRWPFKCKVTFTLLNQSQSDNNYSNSFCCNTTSISFQCPNTNMNSPYGFSKFFPLNLLKQNENYFISDDTLFIKVQVNLLVDITEKPCIDDASQLVEDLEHDDVTGEDDISAMICVCDGSNDAQQSN